MLSYNKDLPIVAYVHEGNGSKFSEFIRFFRYGIIAAKPFILIITTYWILGLAYLSYHNQLSFTHLFVYLGKLSPLLIGLLPAIFIIAAVLGALQRSGRRWKFGLKRVFANRNIANFLVGVTMMIMLCLFMGMFTALKGSFGDLQGFRHDVWQADLDKLLFFGVDPWRVLFTPIHSTLLQIIIEFNYNVFWHIQTFAIITFAAYSDARTKVKMRYLVSMVLVWIIVGGIFAGSFISAGPVFYGFVTGDETRFGEQLAILAQYADSTAIRYQAYLWSAYETNSSDFGTGISAFPSIHVSLVSMNVFFAFEINRKIGFIALIYAIFVGISSVYLAWHYAIDGIAGATIVAAIYYTTRALMTNKTKHQKQAH